MVDVVRGMLSVIEDTGGDGDADHAELIGRLTALNVGTAEPTDAGRDGRVRARARGLSRAQRVGEILVEQHVATPTEVEYALRQQESGDPLHVGEILVEKGAVQLHQVRAALDVQHDQRDQKEQATPASRPSRTTPIRVDVALLDKLMNLVGELVLARNQIMQFTATIG